MAGRLRGTTLWVMVAAAVVAGCGGGDPSLPSSTTTTTPGATPAPGGQAPPAPPLQLELRGLGPVRVGMTLAQAGAALGQPLEDVDRATDECGHYAPRTGLEGVAFLVADGVVARVDVTAGAVTTAAGVAVGQTEAEAQRRYGNRLRATPHDLLIGASYLTLVPPDRADAGFRLVLETDGTRVTSMRAGRLPEVEFTEGCA